MTMYHYQMYFKNSFIIRIKLVTSNLLQYTKYKIQFLRNNAAS